MINPPLPRLWLRLTPLFLSSRPIEVLGPSHQRVRRLRRLGQKRSLRWSDGVCVIEGLDLVTAALDADVSFEALFVDEREVHGEALRGVLARARDAGVRLFALAGSTLERVGDAATPQPLIGVVQIVSVTLDAPRDEVVVLVLHDVRDPGNAGTLIRSADASGVAAVVFSGHSVDPYNPKTLRASAGSIFRVPIIVAPFEEVVNHARSVGIRLLATVVRSAVDFREVDFTAPCAVVIGNESSGLDSVTRGLCDSEFSIAMVGSSESLNAGVAGSLVVFEALRQRKSAGSSHTQPPSP